MYAYLKLADVLHQYIKKKNPQMIHTKCEKL